MSRKAGPGKGKKKFFSAEFSKALGGKVGTTKVDLYDRTIFGLLCLDHPDPDYFSQGIDVEIYSVTAEMLGMFSFVNQAFTTLSNTYRAAMRWAYSAPKDLRGLIDALDVVSQEVVHPR